MGGIGREIGGEWAGKDSENRTTNRVTNFDGADPERIRIGREGRDSLGDRGGE